MHDCECTSLNRCIGGGGWGGGGEGVECMHIDTLPSSRSCYWHTVYTYNWNVAVLDSTSASASMHNMAKG